MRTGDLELADLFDIELQLLRDRSLGRDELRRRDRRIGLAIAASDEPAARRRVLRDWIHELRQGESRESIGARIVRAYEALGWILTLVGLSSGMGAAAAVLAYDGTHPVNAVHFLAVFVGLQLLLVALFLLSATLWRLRSRLPVINGVHGLLRILLNVSIGFVERRLGAEQRTMLQAARGRVRASQIIYGNVERWLLVALAQRFGLWFNLGALATCLYLIAFSDLAFGWQTTLDWSAEGFHRMVALLAAPWAWLDPGGVPSLEVVRQSRTFRLEGAGGIARPELLAQWWRFLVLSLFVYGLLPRVAITAVAHVRLRGALASLRLDHAEIAALVERISSPLVDTRAPLPEPPPAAASAPALAAAAPARATDAAAVIWGDVPIPRADVDSLVSRRFGWRVNAVEQAGVDEAHRDAAAIQAIAGGDSRAPIIVLAEGFEAPTREVRGFVQRLREAAGAERAIVVALVDGDGPGRWTAPASDDFRVWHKHIAALGDPYLRVEALVEGG